MPSAPAEISRLPFLLIRRDQTGPVCPVSGDPMRSPLNVFHSRTVPSSLPVASIFPPGPNRMARTGPVCPASGAVVGRRVAVFHSCTVLLPPEEVARSFRTRLNVSA